MENRYRSPPTVISGTSFSGIPSSVPPLIIKKAVGIAGAVIVRTEHLGREGFPERAGPADACQVIYHADCLIYQADQSCLVHIFAVHDSLKSTVSRIEIDSHAISFPMQNLISLYSILCLMPPPIDTPGELREYAFDFHGIGYRVCGFGRGSAAAWSLCSRRLL